MGGLLLLELRSCGKRGLQCPGTREDEERSDELSRGKEDGVCGAASNDTLVKCFEQINSTLNSRVKCDFSNSLASA